MRSAQASVHGDGSQILSLLLQTFPFHSSDDSGREAWEARDWPQASYKWSVGWGVPRTDPGVPVPSAVPGRGKSGLGRGFEMLLGELAPSLVYFSPLQPLPALCIRLGYLFIVCLPLARHLYGGGL